MKTRTKLIDSLGLGIALWLAGYVSSLLLYFVFPKDVLGGGAFEVFMLFLPIFL